MTSFVESFGTFPYAPFYAIMPSLSFIDLMANATRKIPENIDPKPARAALIQTVRFHTPHTNECSLRDTLTVPTFTGTVTAMCAPSSESIEGSTHTLSRVTPVCGLMGTVIRYDFDTGTMFLRSRKLQQSRPTSGKARPLPLRVKGAFATQVFFFFKTKQQGTAYEFAGPSGCKGHASVVRINRAAMSAASAGCATTGGPEAGSAEMAKTLQAILGELMKH
jgi:hypothetical protein